MSHEKQNKKSLRFWILTTVVLLAPIGLLMLYRAYNRSEFDRRVTALAKEGYPVSLDDLEQRYVLPEGAENAADVYIEAFSYYCPPNSEEIEFLPTCGNYVWPDDVPPFPQEVMDALESYLQRNQKTLDLLDRAATMEYSIWPRTRQATMFWNDSLSEVKKAAQLLNERNLYLAQKGKTDELFSSFQTSIGLSKVFKKQPFLIDHLVTISLKAMCAGNLEDILNQVSFTETQLKTLQGQFSEMQDLNALHAAYIVDRCCTIEFWRLSPDEQAQAAYGSPSTPARLLYSASGLKQQDSLLSLDCIEKNIAASQLPLHQRDKAFKEIEDNFHSDLLSFIRLYLYSTMSSMVKINQIDLRVIGDLRCVETALAVERYRYWYKTVPKSLDELVPDFIAAVPPDPFDGKALRYKLSDSGGYTIYTIGEDGVDNGGLTREQARKMTDEYPPEEFDYAFTVNR